jgi:hypothetical protein
MSSTGLRPVTGACSPAAQPAAPGTVDLTGDLRRPGPVTLPQLAALPQHTVSVQYTSGKGTETRTETGVLLADLLPPDALALTDRKNDQLSFPVLAVGADGTPHWSPTARSPPTSATAASCSPPARTVQR